MVGDHHSLAFRLWSPTCTRNKRKKCNCTLTSATTAWRHSLLSYRRNTRGCDEATVSRLQAKSSAYYYILCMNDQIVVTSSDGSSSLYFYGFNIENRLVWTNCKIQAYRVRDQLGRCPILGSFPLYLYQFLNNNCSYVIDGRDETSSSTPRNQHFRFACRLSLRLATASIRQTISSSGSTTARTPQSKILTTRWLIGLFSE